MHLKVRRSDIMIPPSLFPWVGHADQYNDWWPRGQKSHFPLDIPYTLLGVLGWTKCQNKQIELSGRFWCPAELFIKKMHYPLNPIEQYCIIFLPDITQKIERWMFANVSIYLIVRVWIIMSFLCITHPKRCGKVHCIYVLRVAEVKNES